MMPADTRERHGQEQPPDLGQRDPRVYFAAERTTLAWLRTGITLMGFGFVVARFGLFLHELASARAAGPAATAATAATVAELARGPRLSLWVGVALMALGIWINLGATVRHFRFRGCFERG